MITYSVSIDRIGVVLPLPTSEDTHGVLDFLYTFVGEPSCKVWKTKYTTKANIALSAEHSFCIVVGYTHHKTYCKIDFKPADLDKESWECLFDHLTCMFPHGYASIYHNGKVSYLEIAVDCTGVEWPGLLPFDSKLKKSSWYEFFDAPKPTGYLGTRSSSREIRVYDRVEKLKTKGIVMPGSVTRIEASLRKLNCTVSQLATIKNPFLTFGICKFSDVDAVSILPGGHQFIQCCKLKGASVALLLAGPHRKAFLAQLESMNCDWWDSALCWEGYSPALAILDPVENHFLK